MWPVMVHILVSDENARELTEIQKESPVLQTLSFAQLANMVIALGLPDLWAKFSPGKSNEQKKKP